MVKLFNGKSIPKTDYEDALEYMENSELWKASRILLDYCVNHRGDILASDALDAVAKAIDEKRDYLELVSVHITENLKHMNY
jgi:hypothetical protein